MRPVAVLALVLVIAGCAPTAQERARVFADDGNLLYRRGSYPEAALQYRAALDVQPNDPDLMYNLARCKEKAGRRDEADALYERVLHHQPNHAEAQHAAVARLIERGQRAEAGKLVKAWLKRSPNLAGPYVEDGWLLTLDGDLPSALGRFQQALEIEPRNSRALNELAQVYEKLDRPDRACVLYERILEADADQPEVRRRRDVLLAKGVSRPRPD